jgi:predicted  nucleic acid-binding Zn-ribbon protein
MLIEIAALDAQIVGLKRKLEEIPVQIEEMRQKYREAENLLEGARSDHASMQKDHRKAEGNLDAHLDKIRKLNEQQNLVKTNKEYQALLAEIENLKNEQDRYEDAILTLMEQSGETEKKIADAEKVVQTEKKVFGEEEERLLPTWRTC